MNSKNIRYIFLLFSFFFSALACHAQDNLLKRKVNLTASDQQLESVLMEISDQAGFTFSYNASILPSAQSISFSAQNDQVRATLDKILPKNIVYKVSGNHLILLKKLPDENKAKSDRYTLTGLIYNAANKAPLANIVVYEVSSLISSVTNDKGAFSMTVPADYEKLGLSFNSTRFADTIIFITPEDQHVEVSLTPVKEALPVEKIYSLSSSHPMSIDSIAVVPVTPSSIIGPSSYMQMARVEFGKGAILPGIKNFAKSLGLGTDRNNFAKLRTLPDSLAKPMFADLKGVFPSFATVDTVWASKSTVWDDIRSRAAKSKTAAVESLAVVQKIVPSKSFLRTRNMDMVRENVAQVSFLPNIGTNLKMSGLIRNTLSLNVLAGYAYGVKAFEVGGLFNIVRKEVTGVQAAGLGNVVGEKIRGVQVAGIFNHSQGTVDGVQAAGISNILGDTLQGVQIAGINNILKGDLAGMQIAGINNLSTANVTGVQLAGLSNVGAKQVRSAQIAGLLNRSENVSGLQLAGLGNFAKNDVSGFQLSGLINKGANINTFQLGGLANVATDTLSGVQVSGFLNYAHLVRGAQFGLVNLADTVSGISVGLVSLVKNGYKTPEIYTNEISIVNIAFKTGVKKFYNIFAAGAGSWNGSTRWMFGYGIGTERPLNQDFNLTLEYTASWVNEEKNLQEDLSLLQTLSASFTFRKARNLAISAGPTVNLWLSEWQHPETGEYLSTLAPYTLSETTLGSALAQMWIGGKVAVHF